MIGARPRVLLNVGATLSGCALSERSLAHLFWDWERPFLSPVASWKQSGGLTKRRSLLWRQSSKWRHLETILGVSRSAEA